MAIVVPEKLVHATATRTGCQPAKCALLLEEMLQDFNRLGRHPEMQLAGVELVEVEPVMSSSTSKVLRGVRAEFRFVQHGGRMVVFVKPGKKLIQTVYKTVSGDAVEITSETLRHSDVLGTLSNGKINRINDMLYRLRNHVLKTVEHEFNKKLAGSAA